MQAFAAPFLYCLLLGSAWGVFFKKKFADSLAPAFMLHIIIVMLAGMTLHKLSVGIWGGMLLFAGALAYKIWKAPQEARAWLSSAWFGGICVFTLFYIFCFIVNDGKRFWTFDEFSHWGMFVKESLRLDRLYAESRLPFWHKDYVPAATLVEVIWCRLSGGFQEAHAYRALQMLGFSMMLPLIDSAAQDECGKGAKISRSFVCLAQRLGAAFLVLIAFQAIFDERKFNFYTALKPDAVLGIVFFYCCMLAYHGWNREGGYRVLVLALGFSALALTKQTGIALLPMVFVYAVANRALFAGRRLGRGDWGRLFAALLLPVALWYGFAVFAQGFSDNLLILEETAKQNYATVDFSSLLHLFEAAPGEERGLPYQIFELFTEALLRERVVYLFAAPYVAILVCVAGAIFAVACAAEGGYEVGAQPKKIAFAGVFVFLSGVAYALFVYLVYVLTFPDYWALRLGSYVRYMATYVLAMLLFMLFVYYDSKVWKQHRVLYALALVASLLYLAFSSIPVAQMTQHGSERMFESLYKSLLRRDNMANNIASEVPADKGMCIVNASWFSSFQHLRFYLFPRPLNSLSENFLERETYTEEELRTCLSVHEYFFVYYLDADILDRYIGVFANPGELKNYTLYQAHAAEGGSFRLEKRAYAGDSEHPRDRWTALMLATHKGHAEMVRQLLASGAEVDAADAKGMTALQMAAQRGYAVTAGTLLDAGADVNRPNPQTGWTPLMHATRHGHEDVVRLLLEHGANAKAKARGKKGVTALQLAEQRGHKGIVQMLREAAEQKESADAAPLVPGEERD